MNELFILIWLGDIAERFSVLLFMSGLVAAFGAVFASVIYHSEERRIPRFIKAFAVIGFASMFLSSIVPSKNWFYIAAGGTVAVSAFNSDLGQKVVKLVEQKIDAALKEGAK